ncbi:MAG: RHS repeat-associated core domain-containing protein [Thermogemmata sp.]|nr:RHS repeat-associated core domain-containing protein [Thermogemmata sp.]
MYLHQGGRFDGTSGLCHFRYRDYSPTLGRWTSIDLIRHAAGDVNLYQALGNSPINTVEPSRLDWLDWVLGGLDVLGVFDPTPICDGANALILLGRGDWTGAGLSAVSMIPYVGDVVGKGGKAVRCGKKVVDTTEAAKPAAKQADNANTSVVRQADEVAKHALGNSSVPPPTNPGRPFRDRIADFNRDPSK